MEFLSLVGPALTFALFLIGLAVWRYQTLGKRRFEITERAMTVARKVVPAIHHIRDSERSIKSGVRFSQNYIIEISGRLQANTETFEELSRVRDLIDLYYGETEAAPFKELETIHADIVAAVIGITTRDGAEVMFPKPEQTEQVTKWKQTYSAEEGGDDISRRVDTAATTIRKRFGRRLRPRFWDFLWPT